MPTWTTYVTMPADAPDRLPRGATLSTTNARHILPNIPLHWFSCQTTSVATPFLVTTVCHDDTVYHQVAITTLSYILL